MGIVSLTEFCEGKKWPTKKTFYWLRFKNPNNFRKLCCRRLGRKVFVDVNGFGQWLQQSYKVDE